MRYLVILISMVTQLSCSTDSGVSPSISQWSRHGLEITINGQRYQGVGIIDKADKFEIEIHPQEKISRLIIATCHRETVVDKPKTGWFKKSYKFDYAIVKGLEDMKACLMSITVLDGKNKKHGFALFDFLDARPRVSLSADLRCNGVARTYAKGASICQSAKGLYQQIVFKDPVLVRAQEDCVVPETKDRLTFTWPISVGSCTYYFMANKRGPDDKRLLHRHTSLGYTEVPYLAD